MAQDTCSIEECAKRAPDHRLCPMHRSRLAHHGTTDDPTPSVEQRFWAKVDKSGECWLWTAAIDRNGYGKFRHQGGAVFAHRVAYELEVGPVPDGLELDHLCRVPRCVRSDHLEPVTHRDNLLRGATISARNAAKTHCPQGHPYDEANTKFTRGGWRTCRTCRNLRSRLSYARTRVA